MWSGEECNMRLVWQIIFVVSSYNLLTLIMEYVNHYSPELMFGYRYMNSSKLIDNRRYNQEEKRIYISGCLTVMNNHITDLYQALPYI